MCDECGLEVMDLKNHKKSVHLSALHPLKCPAESCDHTVKSGRPYDLKKHMRGAQCRRWDNKQILLVKRESHI